MTSASAPTLTCLLLITLLQHFQHHQAHAARSLSARRVRGIPSTRSSAEKYDRSITTFSPDGRLLQLDYALIAAEERGRGLTVCVEYDGVVIFAFPSGNNDDHDGDEDMNSCKSIADPSSSVPEVAIDSMHSTISVDEDDVVNRTETDDRVVSLAQSQKTASFVTCTDYDPMQNSKVYRLSPTHLLLTSGLAGDSRALASAFRRVSSSWTHMTFGEVITARELAKEMGKVMHSIGLRPGARVLGVIGILIGMDDRDDTDDDGGVEVRMYRSLPGGTIDRCNVCCTGGGADASGNAARKDAMETLLRVMTQTTDDHESTAEESISKNVRNLQTVIEEVARMALKYQTSAVDIWLVKAVESSPPKQEDLNQKSVSPHRYLGKATMNTRYARRVSLDQIANAARSLMNNNAKI